MLPVRLTGLKAEFGLTRKGVPPIGWKEPLVRAANTKRNSSNDIRVRIISRKFMLCESTSIYTVQPDSTISSREYNEDLTPLSALPYLILKAR